MRPAPGRRQIRGPARRLLVPLLIVGLAVFYLKVMVPRFYGLPTVRTVDLTTTVKLANGTTLSVVRGPDVVENIHGRRVYGFQVRFCPGSFGGQDERITFSHYDFTLVTAGTGAHHDAPYDLVDHPRVGLDKIFGGKCREGWLFYNVEPVAGSLVGLRYTNLDHDRVTWRTPGGGS